MTEVDVLPLPHGKVSDEEAHFELKRASSFLGLPDRNIRMRLCPFVRYDRDRPTADADRGNVDLVSSRERLPPHERRTMLVLTRKKNESIVIRDDIVVMVVEIQGDKVRLGIEAPKEVTVHRREVYEAIDRARAEPTRPR